VTQPVTIRRDFQGLLPPLNPQEGAALEASLLAEGCRDALVLWRGILVDGHHRYAICQRHRLTFSTIEQAFASADHAKLWIRQTQAARRNHTDDQRACNAYEMAALASGIAKRERGQKAVDAREVKAGRKQPILDTTSASKIEPKGRASRSVVKASKTARVSERKIRQAGQLAVKAPGLFKQVASGEMSLADSMRAVTRTEVIAALDSIDAKKAKAVRGVYDVIVIDPPWPMQKIDRDERPLQTQFDYPRMTEPELAALPIPAADAAHVWVWTTQRFLPMALRLLDAWGLTYVCAFVWHKAGGFQPMGLPQYNCEFALYARRGVPIFVDTKGFPTCFGGDRTGHSEKPDAFYATVRRVTGGRRLDMFNRRAIEGFDGWGKESA
jgi:N6-adenosine-specific RNA methylase IME4